MKKIKNIVYITSTPFPYGSASSARTRNMVKLLIECNFRVTVIADYKNGMDECFQSIYLSEKQLQQKELSIKCIEALNDLIKKQTIDAVISNATYYKISRLLPFCLKNDIKLIVENCEWYDKSNYKFQYINPHYLRNQYMLKYLFKKVSGFISISNFLDKRNLSLGKPSVRIPTIIDKNELDASFHSKGKKIILSYCGNPGVSKELLYPIVDVMRNCNLLKNNIEFHIYGPTIDQFLKNTGVNKSSLKEEYIIFHGKVPQQEMHVNFQNSDFIIFLRPYRRSSNAGFPTKLAESMIAGTPVIANDTGDIALYLNETNGFLLRSISSDILVKCFKYLLELTDDVYVEMRKQCRIDAEKYFDFRNYKNIIIKLFEELEKD